MTVFAVHETHTKLNSEIFELVQYYQCGLKMAAVFCLNCVRGFPLLWTDLLRGSRESTNKKDRCVVEVKRAELVVVGHLPQKGDER